MIGRWADGHCTHSKSKVTGAQLVVLGLAKYDDDAIVLTAAGKGAYKDIHKEDK